MSIDAGILFTTCVSLLGLLATYLSLRGNMKKDRNERARRALETQERQTERHIEVKKELEYLNKDMSEISNSVKGIDNSIRDIDKRLVTVEESTKSAHKRLDEMKNELGGDD